MTEDHLGSLGTGLLAAMASTSPDGASGGSGMESAREEGEPLAILDQGSTGLEMVLAAPKGKPTT